ncbi:MAG: hypothetical protein R3D46_12795 [Defluviimonas denitrificans]
MATIFDVFYLGTVAALDPTEGNTTAENAASLLGATFGSRTDPLFSAVQTLAPVSYSGGSSTAYDTDNLAANDTFSIDGGAAQTFDTLVIYNATITYADGSTAVITANVMQDTAGNLYLVPETTYNTDQTARGRADPVADTGQRRWRDQQHDRRPLRRDLCHGR